MQVGNPFVGINHGKRRTVLVDSLDISLDLGSLLLRKFLDLRIDVTKSVVDRHAKLFQGISMLVEHILVEYRHSVTEHDRVGNFHHGSLQVKRQEQVLVLCRLNLSCIELTKLADIHDRRIDHLTLLERETILQDRDIATLVDIFDTYGIGTCHCCGLLGLVKIPPIHVGHMSLRIFLPCSQAMRIVLGILLDRCRSTAVGVTLAKHGVYSTAENFCITSLDLLFLVRLRIFRIVRNIVAFSLQFLDSCLQLGN